MSRKLPQSSFVRTTAFLAIWSVCLNAAAAQQPDATARQPAALNHTGIYALNQELPNVAGRYVKVAVIARSFTYIDGKPQNDYRPAPHTCFRSADISFYDDGQIPPGISPHCTAVCSILFGYDGDAQLPEVGSFLYNGIVPQAQGRVYEFWHFLKSNVFTATAPDANIIVASMGTQFEDWWTRGFESLAQRNNILIVAGIGNGAEAGDPILYPAAGANAIAVGVIDSADTNDLAAAISNFLLPHPDHSTTGPTFDKRAKPDIVAPGNCLVADYLDPAGYYAGGSYASFATPIVGGAAALLMDAAIHDARLKDAADSNAAATLIKTVLLNSAAKLPFWHKGLVATADDHEVPLDYLQGAGMLDALAAYKNLAAGRQTPGPCRADGWDINRIPYAVEAANTYTITLDEPADKVITVTTTWNRHYLDAYPFDALLNKDLDLRLELWAVDYNDPFKDYLLDYSDSTIDNLEHIYAKADPNFSTYEIIVYHSFIDPANPPDLDLPYALAWRVSDRPAQDDILWYDLNADGTVDMDDTAVLVDNMLNVLEKPDQIYLGDINQDGKITPDDLEILLTHVDETAPWAQ